MHLNWDHIRFFLALAEQGTLSLSARVLGVSHSTVLRRIRQLEIELNTQLFDHTNTGYILTPAGLTLHTEATKMRSTMSAISREISGADRQMQGEIVITTTDTLAQRILPKLIAKLSAKHTELNFSLYISNELSDMGNREADIAIRTCKTPPQDLIGRRVAEIKFTAAASRAYVQKHALKTFPAIIDEHQFITLDDSFSSASFYQWLQNRIGQSKLVTTTNSFLYAAALANEGLGITLLPTFMLGTENDLVGLGTTDDISPNDLWVLSHSDSRNTEKVRVVRQYLYEELPIELERAG